MQRRLHTSAFSLLPRHLTILTLSLACTFAAAGCNDDDVDEEEQTLPPTPPPSADGWFQPTADMTWQWQITGTLNASYDVDVYDLDIFDNDAATIRALHESGRKVVCYFSAGTYEPWRDDAGDYDPADIGNPLADWPDERWVDHRSNSVRAILQKRLDLTAASGCDAVEPDNVTAYRNDSGFPITADDQLDFNRWLAAEAHARGLGIGLKNDDQQVAELAADFDFSVSEECHQFDECDAYAPFLEQNKPVFNAEYANSAAEADALALTLCPKALAAGTRTVIFSWDLDDAFRVSCD